MPRSLFPVLSGDLIIASSVQDERSFHVRLGKARANNPYRQGCKVLRLISKMVPAFSLFLMIRQSWCHETSFLPLTDDLTSV